MDTSLEMNSAIQVRILEEVVCISHNAWKGMNRIIASQAIGK